MSVTAGRPAREGPGVYRRKYGQPGAEDDEAAVASVRAALPGLAMPDEEILAAIGWACTVDTAVAKVREYQKPLMNARRRALLVQVTKALMDRYDDPGWRHVADTYPPAKLSGLMGYHVATVTGAITRLQYVADAAI
jgi:hypothetical protein